MRGGPQRAAAGVVATLVVALHAAAAASCPSGAPTTVPPLPRVPEEDPSVEHPRAGDPGAPTTIITRDENSEVVDLGHPGPAQTTSSEPSDCPHEADGLIPWSDAVGSPTEGADVVIDGNRKVLLACSPGVRLGKITVNAGSELIIGDAVVELETSGIEVKGALRAGSPTCRLRSEIAITLYGERPAATTPVPAFWVKGIDATGTLDLHAVEYYHSWSRLAATAEPGDAYVLLQDPVNWEPGQTVVVTTTQLKDARDWHQNELRTVANASAASHLGRDVTAVFFDAPLAFRHYAGREYQAEVGVLSRRLTIQGAADDSEPTDTEPLACANKDYASYPCPNHLTGYGGHVVARGPDAVMRIQGVEFYRMGQTNFQGRYPVHWHLVGDAGAASYIRDSSVHRSFYKAVTIHGTNEVEVSRNVAHDVIGHGLYLEDGVEERNAVLYNLVAHVHPIGGPPPGEGSWSQQLPEIASGPDLVTASDSTASGFYVSNPYNRIKGNAAVGGFSGFQVPVFPAPIGLHRARTDVIPKNRPTLEFDGNSCRSTGAWWGHAGCLYAGGEFYHTDDSLDPDAPMVYSPGRSSAKHETCQFSYEGIDYCPQWNRVRPECGGQPDPWACYAWINVTNFKASLVTVGAMTWGQRIRLDKFEAHDINGGPAAEIFGHASMDDVLVTCRTPNAQVWFCGEDAVPDDHHGAPAPETCTFFDRRFWQRYTRAIQWYDTGMSTVLSRATFRSCDPVEWPGCEGSCLTQSSIFHSLTHSSQFLPEWMSVTAAIRFEDDARVDEHLMGFNNEDEETISGAMAGWVDVDGTGCNRPEWGTTIFGSNYFANEWWKLDADCELVGHAPAVNGGERLMWCCPARGRLLAHVDLDFDDESRLRGNGGDDCHNGFTDAAPCARVGKMAKFGDDDLETQGLVVRARPEVVGAVATTTSETGAGWYLHLDAGAPRNLTLSGIQAHPDAIFVLATPYPKGTEFAVAMDAVSWCYTGFMCHHDFREVGSLAELVEGGGDEYFVDRDAHAAVDVLYVRAVTRLHGYLQTDPELWDPDVELPMFADEYFEALEPRGYWGVPYRPTHDPELTVRATNCGVSTVNPYFCAGGPLPVVIPPLLWDATYPTAAPTLSPTTPQPTSAPTSEPTVSPTSAPMSAPTLAPTPEPTVSPTPEPTQTPGTPTASPTATPPMASPTTSPSTGNPTDAPSLAPAATPTAGPTTATPSMAPTVADVGPVPVPVPVPAPTTAPTPVESTGPASGRGGSSGGSSSSSSSNANDTKMILLAGGVGIVLALVLGGLVGVIAASSARWKRPPVHVEKF